MDFCFVQGGKIGKRDVTFIREMRVSWDKERFHVRMNRNPCSGLHSIRLMPASNYILASYLILFQKTDREWTCLIKLSHLAFSLPNWAFSETVHLQGFYEENLLKIGLCISKNRVSRGPRLWISRKWRTLVPLKGDIKIARWRKSVSLSKHLTAS